MQYSKTRSKDQKSECTVTSRLSCAPCWSHQSVPLEDQVSGVGVYGQTSLQAFRPEQQMDGFVATRWHERGWDLQLRRQGVDVASVRDMSDGRSSIMASGKRTTYTGGRRGHE